MSFGILIMGPSGSGKSTLTSHLQQIYTNLDIPTTIISLDPANQTVKYKPDIDITDLITIEDVMQQYSIGYNYANEVPMQPCFIWLIQRIKPKLSTLLIIDLPGQIELYINHDSTKNIINSLVKLGLTICTVELFDCTYVYDLKHFMSLCMMSLATLVHFQTPHVNVLSKIDIMKERRPDGDFTQILNCNSLAQMVQMLNTKQKDSQYLESISKIIDSYGMVSFIPLDVSRIQLMANLIFDIQTSLGSIQTRQHYPKFKPALYRSILKHELQNELFPQQQHDKEYYQDFLKQWK